MLNKWKEKGIIFEDGVLTLAREFEYDFYVAYQTDKFLAGKKQQDSLDRIDVCKLLEIRLFSGRKELLITRSMIGQDSGFQWRVASEDNLTSDEYIERVQTIDVDTGKTRLGEFGNYSLMTTGGGAYELPIEKGHDGIKVVSYIGYKEDDGMAYIYDNRLAGFVKGGIE